MSSTQRAFKVTVPALPDVTQADWREYIADAVGCWKGQFHPENPLFDLDRDEVTVVGYRRPRKADNPETLQAILKLLAEAAETLEEFEDDGRHHQVCDLRQRITTALKEHGA